MKIYEIRETDRIIDGADGSLRTGSGAPVDLRPQSREVLQLLVATPGEVVTRETFTDVIWGGRLVSEDSLVQCIAEIRAALGDAGRDIIQTVPRKGYRFQPPRSGAPTKQRSTISTILMVVGIAAATFVLAIWMGRDALTGPAPVVAVLPFEDMSPPDTKGYLSDALAEGVITELAKFNQFSVVARNSSFQFRDRATDVREIGETLGAGYVVEGSQQFDGDNVRITVQLIEADTGVHVFADRYERDLDDLFAVQDDIVRQVAAAVGQMILSDMPERAAPRDVDSRLRGLQARNIMTQLSYENWQKALALEEQSIAEEPDSAWGYIGKSLMLGTASATGWMKPKDAVLEEATALAEEALRLDPENYMSHFTLARVLSRRGENAASILQFERAAELNPSDSIIWIGMSVPLLYIGNTERALEVLDIAARVDPLHGDWLRWQQGLAHWQAGECEAGLEAMQSMASPPGSSYRALAVLLVCLDRIEEAREALGTYLEARPDHTRATEAEGYASNWVVDGVGARWLDALERAGLPE